jgi:hypothetical protein
VFGSAVGILFGQNVTRVTVQENAAVGWAAEAEAFRRVWRPGKVYLFHPSCSTPMGLRYPDICEWNDIVHLFASRWRPNKCWEVKAGHAFYGGIQKRKDDWLREHRGFRVILIRVPRDHRMFFDLP